MHFEYRRNMLKLADAARGAMRTRKRTLISDINDWIAHMYNLANRVDYFEDNDLAARDLQQVPRKIAEVERLIKNDNNEQTRRDRAAAVGIAAEAIDEPGGKRPHDQARRDSSGEYLVGFGHGLRSDVAARHQGHWKHAEDNA